jgi:hypothetical protein
MVMGKKKSILSIIVFACMLFLAFAQISSAQTLSITDSVNWPCDSCHPHEKVGEKTAHKTIELIWHDKLSEDRRAACRVCHLGDENPALLKLADGTTVSIADEVPKLCYQCHQRKYKDWMDGIHGKQPKCTTIGCHNSHAPRMDKKAAEEAVEATFSSALTESIPSKPVLKKVELPFPPIQSNPPSPHFRSLNIFALVVFLAVVALIVGPTVSWRRKR